MFDLYYLANDSSSRESLNHLSCIAFLSATDASIEAVKQELAKPRYGSYQLCKFSSVIELIVDFSNTLSKRQIEEMATVDEFEVVKEVQVCLFRRWS
jgi:vacuolar protein sorting-associated protein 45